MSWINIYWKIHYIVEGPKNYNFDVRFGAKLQGVGGLVTLKDGSLFILCLGRSIT